MQNYKFLIYKMGVGGGGYCVLKKGSYVATPCFTHTEDDYMNCYEIFTRL